MCHCGSLGISVYACWIEAGTRRQDIGSAVMARPGPGSARESASRTKERRNPNPFAMVLRSFGGLALPILHRSITPLLRRSSMLYSRPMTTTDELERSVNIYRGLVEVSALINSITDFNELLSAILDVAGRVMHGEASSLFLINESTGDLELTIARGPVGDALSHPIKIPRAIVNSRSPVDSLIR